MVLSTLLKRKEPSYPGQREEPLERSNILRDNCCPKRRKTKWS